MIALIGDHLWQSTLFAAAAGLLCLALRNNRAQVRYWLWLTASVKFLLPFAALVAMGGYIEWRAPLPAAAPAVTLALDAVSQPFSSVDLGAVEPVVPGSPEGPPLQTALLAIWAGGVAVMLAIWYVRWRRVAAHVRTGSPVTDGRELEHLRRLERASGLSRPIAMVSSTESIEPGVFGILRPVLLWPRTIGGRLTDEQIEAILAHEVVHVRRRDNLSATVHMVVHAVFWFHPFVWWLSARLVDERERACDQEVIRLGSQPEVYAESILKTCQFYVESPLPCVSGVTGSDLKRRIEEIMRNRAGMALNSWKKLLLATAALATCAGPVLLGGLNARPLQTQTGIVGIDGGQSTPPASAEKLEFEAATIKPNPTGEMRVMMRNLPGGGYEANNITLRAMIQQAFRLAEFQVIGGPAWLESERYDILAKSPAGAGPAEFGLRLQSLLIERLNLKTHRETRDAPIYALVLARADGRLGPQLRPSSADCSPAALARGRANAAPPAAGAAGRQQMPMPMPVMPPLGESRPCTMMRGGGKLSAGGQTMATLATTLQNNTGRIVQDRTGLTGAFDFDLEFTPDPSLGLRGPGGGLPGQPENPRPVDPDAITIFTAVQEQLGLKLESTRGPVEVLVIDSADRPTEN